MQNNWTWNERDAAVAAAIQKRLPAAIYDAHAHIYTLAQLGDQCSELWTAGPDPANVAAWRRSVDRMVGAARLRGGLLIPVPRAGIDYAAVNEFLLSELRADPESRGLLLVGPTLDRKRVEAWLDANPGRVAGFKPYHLMSTQQPTFQAPISTYMPEWAWELAHRHGLAITLHMVRDRALADPDNQREIRQCCERYPKAKLILAHGARGFHAPNTAGAIESLHGLDNVWFDASGLCESGALAAILREYGPRRLLWGSDFPISEKRGKCVTIGDNFAWINPERVDAYATAPEVHTLPVGLENLLATLEAADACFLNDEDLRDVFCENARRVLGLAREDGGRTQALYRHARERIPGGVHLLSKRPEMFAPGQWPAHFREARGCEVWDMDGRHYYDMSILGIGSTPLGFRDPDVTRAVQRRVAYGSMSSLNPPEEVELADLLCELHPWAEQARFARTGGEAAAVAVRIARATTDRSAIALCGYHGWADWYLAANLGDSDALRGHLLPGLNPLGVPREIRGTAYPFAYNDRAALSKIIAEQGSRLAAVVMEPCRNADPEPGFLEFVRDEAHKAGAILIFDEITIGFRRAIGGSHLLYNVTPDIAMFAKALSNGHPMAAVIGTKAAMEGAHTSFISSAFWTEGVGPAAAVAAIRKMQKVNLPAHLDRMGTLIMKTITASAGKHGVPLSFKSFTCAPLFTFEHPQPQELKTLYVQLMLERGFLASPLVYVCLAHTEEIVRKFAAALDEVFAQLGEAIRRDDIVKRLKGPVAHTGFRRLI